MRRAALMGPRRFELREVEVPRGEVAHAERLQPDSPVSDAETASDEMFQNAGEKRCGAL